MVDLLKRPMRATTAQEDVDLAQSLVDHNTAALLATSRRLDLLLDLLRAQP